MKINFLGIGSAWNIQEDNNSAFIKLNNKMILIDCGETVARKIIYYDILKDIRELFILISHTHSDHIGSIGTLLFYSKYGKKIENKIVLPENETFGFNLKEYLRLVDITNEVEYITINDLKKTFNFKRFEILDATHVDTIPCYCFVFEDDEGLIYYSADNSNINYIQKFLQYQNSKIYTDVCNNASMIKEHMNIEILKTYVSLEDRSKIYLMHIDENLDLEELKGMGFNIPKTYEEERRKKLWKKK